MLFKELKSILKSDIIVESKYGFMGMQRIKFEDINKENKFNAKKVLALAPSINGLEIHVYLE